MILNLLKGTNEEAQNRLQRLSEEIGEDPNLLWYPSAGNDYRHLLELTDAKAKQYNIDLLPDLMIHTDYMPSSVTLEGIAHEDEMLKSEIISKCEVQLTTDFNYCIYYKYVGFPFEALPEPTIYLLDVKVTSKSMDVITKPVLYFLFENINFFEEIILKNRLRISHIVKIREGCGDGGNKKSISIAYAFLSALNTNFLIIDEKERTDFKLVETLKHKYNLSPTAYTLNKLNSYEAWSSYRVNVFSTEFNSSPMTDEILKGILKGISNEPSA